MPGKKTILIVDDDPTILNMLATTLQASYDVLKAEDGVAAAYVYEDNIETVAAIVTDLDMPRLNGQSLAEWVHHLRPRLPVIIISGRIRTRHSEDFSQAPMTRFLGKPFEPARLEALLHDALADGSAIA
jgi:two-component system cell cycle sensor histidine kinase/response regulator CckA